MTNYDVDDRFNMNNAKRGFIVKITNPSFGHSASDFNLKNIFIRIAITYLPLSNWTFFRNKDNILYAKGQHE